MCSPQMSHFYVAHTILQYLKGTVGLGLSFRETIKLELIIYTDSGFAKSLADYMSATG